MSAVIKQQYISFYSVGSIIEIPVDFVTNNGPGIATDVKVTVAYPAGLTYSSDTLSQGSYNDNTKEWLVGSLIKDQTVTGFFYFTVVTEADYAITFTVSTATGCDSCLANNEVCITTYGVSCSDMQSCLRCSIKPITDPTYTLTLSDDTILIDTTANVVDLALPDPSVAYDSVTGKSKVFTMKLVDFTNAATVATPTGVIVDNTDVAGAAASFIYSLVGEAITVKSDGTNYYIV